MKLYIKNMVSQRCIMFVEKELKKLRLGYTEVSLGVVELTEEISQNQLEELSTTLNKSGLTILDDSKSILNEKIKTLVIESIHHSDEQPASNYSNYISEKLNYDYNYLSNLFSEINGITIQQFIIIHKIEKVKELLLYGELTLTEISIKMYYSSVAHLSTQFKKSTGLTPTVYKQSKKNREFPLENILKNLS